MFKSPRIFTRKKIIAAVAIGATGLIVGGLFVAQANTQRADSVAASSQLSGATGFKSEPRVAHQIVAKAQADLAAQKTIGQANQVIAAVQGKVDATSLASSVASLAGYSSLDAFTVRSLTEVTSTATQQTQAAAAEADRVAAAEAAAAAAAQAAAAQAEAAARAQAAARVQAAGSTPDGARAIARNLAASKYGWGAGQFSCLNQLWQKESGWSSKAVNASGATGIAQALPGSKMASFGADWKTSAATQIAWGLDYIQRGYGTPCAAMAHSAAVNWY